MTEAELGELFEDCETGSVPAAGAPYGIETVVDERLVGQPEIGFEAGDHELLVHLSGEQFGALLDDARRGRYGRHP